MGFPSEPTENTSNDEWMIGLFDPFPNSTLHAVGRVDVIGNIEAPSSLDFGLTQDNDTHKKLLTGYTLESPTGESEDLEKFVSTWEMSGIDCNFPKDLLKFPESYTLSSNGNNVSNFVNFLVCPDDETQFHRHSKLVPVLEEEIVHQNEMCSNVLSPTMEQDIDISEASTCSKIENREKVAYPVAMKVVDKFFNVEGNTINILSVKQHRTVCGSSDCLVICHNESKTLVKDFLVNNSESGEANLNEDVTSSPKFQRKRSEIPLKDRNKLAAKKYREKKKHLQETLKNLQKGTSVTKQKYNKMKTALDSSAVHYVDALMGRAEDKNQAVQLILDLVKDHLRSVSIRKSPDDETAEINLFRHRIMPVLCTKYPEVYTRVEALWMK